MLKYVSGRMVECIPVVVIMSMVVFLIMYVLPGDPATLMLLGYGVTSKEQILRLREEMGLNDPLYVQYGRFLAGAMRGDLGSSIRFRKPVTDLLMAQFPATLRLATGGMLVAVVIGIITGTAAAIWRGSWVDTLTMFVALFAVSAPVFWLGLMLIFLFAFRLGWLPSTGGGGWRGIILPMFTLGIMSAGIITRITRSCLLEVMSQDYIRTARAKGLKESLVIYRHAMKNAMIPIVTVVGLEFGSMLGGTVITEQVFSRPGIGRLLVYAVLDKDFRLAQGTILLVALCYLLVNVLVDVSYAWFDPRVGHQ